MREDLGYAEHNEFKAVLAESEVNPYRKFNIAFSLMSVMPFLVFFYLLVAKLFTFTILVGNTGFLLFISIVISLGGFGVGYSLMRNILNRLIFYAAKAKHGDQLKSKFVATVSHEFKNPLSIINLNLFNIKNGLLGQINEEQRKIIDACQGIIERLNHLISDILDLHKIEAGMLQTNRKICNIIELVEKGIREFEVMLNKKRIRLVKETAEDNIQIWADEDKIIQVINNLLSNAIKYTPENGSITLRAYKYDGFVRLEFHDSAESIPSDKLDKIFDKFQRLNLAKEGTGLGLSISKDIIELHRGRIWAESQPHIGNRFIVVLPRDLRQTKR